MVDWFGIVMGKFDKFSLTFWSKNFVIPIASNQPKKLYKKIKLKFGGKLQECPPDKKTVTKEPIKRNKKIS
jgi:hypothetical protein